MKHVTRLMKEFRSFKLFRQWLEPQDVSRKQVEIWHRQIRQIEKPTLQQEQFIRGFYREFHEILDLNLRDMINDRRWQPPKLNEEDVLLTVVATLYDIEVISGSTGEVARSLIELFGMPYEVETLRSRLSGIVVPDEELKEVLLRMISDHNKQKGRKP